MLKPNGVLIIAVPNFKSFDATYYENFWAAYDVLWRIRISNFVGRISHIRQASWSNAGQRMNPLSRISVIPPPLEEIVADTHVIKDFANRLVDDVLDALGPVIK